MKVYEIDSGDLVKTLNKGITTVKVILLEDYNKLLKHATRFEIPTNKYTHSCNLKLEYRGKDKWVVLDPHGNCWDFKENDWAWEPMPSARTDEFIESCRCDFETGYNKIQELIK